MNLKPLILILPFMLTGCVKLYPSGYSENINASTFFLPKLESFMYCNNPYFESFSFISGLNEQNEHLPARIVAITSLQDIEGPEYNDSVQVPMKCKGIFTFADNHSESGMIRVNVLDQYMLSFDMEIVLTYKLSITWRSEEQIAKRKQQIAEDKKRLIEIDKQSKEILAHPSYKCIYLSLNSDGDLNHTTRIVSKPAACGNNPYDKYYPGFDDLIEEKVELQHNIQRAEKD